MKIYFKKQSKKNTFWTTFNQDLLDEIIKIKSSK